MGFNPQTYATKPDKDVWPPEKQERICSLFVKRLKELFDSDERIKEVRIYGSCAKKTLGHYKETYKPGTPTARDYSDIDAVFLVDGIQDGKVLLKNEYLLERGRFMKDPSGNDVHVEKHPIICADMTSPQDYYANLDKDWPEGYSHTKDSILLFKRE